MGKNMLESLPHASIEDRSNIMASPFFSKLRSQKHYLNLIKADLKQVSEFVEAQANCFDSEVVDYMETVCQTKGKMLRPALVLLIAGATGGIKQEHIRLGAILEMIHMASLVHDDVIDMADKRRDVPTANSLWGNSLAVLLGDILFSHAMVVSTEFNSIDFCKRLASIVRDVCQGEVAQSSRLYDLSMTKEEYFEIIRKKTASLFSAATGGSAWLSNVSPEIENALYQLGDLLGVAYQIYDDCLDMVGDEDDAGKTLHTDASKGKLTLPIFYLLECGDRNVEASLREAIENQETVDYSKLKDNPVYADSVNKAIQVALNKNEAAREILWLLPQTEYREALAELTFYLDELLEDCRVSQ